MRKVRVAINALTELTAKYGSRVYLLGLAEELARCDSVELVLLVGKGQTPLLPKALHDKAREIEGAAPRSFAQFFLQTRIRAVLASERIDVYHVPNTLPLWRFIPTVVTIHDLTELRIRKYSYLRTLYRSVLNYTAARWADHVVTVSENSKRDIVKYLGIAPEKIDVTYVGVGESFRVRDREECKGYVSSKYGIHEDFLLAPGGLSKNKNLNNILMALKELHLSGVKVPLVITGFGTGKDINYLNHFIAKLSLSEFVTVTGYVPDSEMPFLYGACSVVLYPSLYEGFGLPAVEAMACGALLMASDTSSLPEVMGEAGLKVCPERPDEIADGVRRLLFCNEDARRRRVDLGLQRVEQFRWKKVAARTVEVYKALAKSPGRVAVSV